MLVRSFRPVQPVDLHVAVFAPLRSERRAVVFCFSKEIVDLYRAMDPVEIDTDLIVLNRRPREILGVVTQRESAMKRRKWDFKTILGCRA